MPRLEELYPRPKIVFGPQSDYYPDKARCSELIQGGGYYPCACGSPTNFQVYIDDGKVEDGVRAYYARVCSTECYEKVTGTKVDWPPVPEKPPAPVVAPPETEPEESMKEPEAPAVSESELHPDLKPHPSGEELPKPKLTKEMIEKLLKKK